MRGTWRFALLRRRLVDSLRRALGASARDLARAIAKAAGGAVFAVLVFVSSCGGGSGAASPAAAPSSTVPAAVGRTFYVSPAGSDTADGLAPERAFATLQKAADATRP